MAFLFFIQSFKMYGHCCKAFVPITCQLENYKLYTYGISSTYLWRPHLLQLLVPISFNIHGHHFLVFFFTFIHFLL